MASLLWRLKITGAVLVVAGLVLAGVGFFYGTSQATDGLDSAQAMYEEQGVTLSYNDDGQLTDRGTPEGARAILEFLEVENQYPVNHDNLDPNDPIVNTRDELMYEYAVITYHVLHGSVDVELTEDDVPITYRGVEYTEPGTYEITVEKYYAQFDRQNPIESQLRGAWSPMVISLTSSLAGGHANQAVGELAYATTLGFTGIGLLFALGGVGLIWVALPSPSKKVAIAPMGRENPSPNL